jgi:hypothetical protein
MIPIAVCIRLPPWSPIRVTKQDEVPECAPSPSAGEQADRTT